MLAVRFALPKLLGALTTIYVALTVNFLLFRVLPGDAVTNISRVPNAPPGLREKIAAQFGVDKPLLQQYVAYLRELLNGNLGISYANRQPVSENLGRAIANTLPMVGLGVLLAIGVGVLAGVIAAYWRGTWIDRGTTSVAIAFFSFPVQWLALVLLYLLADHFPTQGMSDPFLIDPTFAQLAADRFRHMFLPSLTVALSLYGAFILIMRSSMLETMGDDYVVTARAVGWSNCQIIRRHVLRNALLPTTSLIALTVGSIVGGAVLVETVFSWPGVGLAVTRAVEQRDYPMLQGAFLVLTVAVVVANLLADVAAGWLDPRVRDGG